MTHENQLRKIKARNPAIADALCHCVSYRASTRHAIDATVERVDASLLAYGGDNIVQCIPLPPEDDGSNEIVRRSFFLFLADMNKQIAVSVKNEPRRNFLRDIIDYQGRIYGTKKLVSGMVRVDECVYYDTNGWTDEYKYTDLTVRRGEIKVVLYLPPQKGWLSVTMDECYKQVLNNSELGSSGLSVVELAEIARRKGN